MDFDKALFIFSLTSIDFYKMDKDNLKKLYYKLSLQYHPDKNEGKEEYTQKFQDVQNAYELLNNYIEVDVDQEEVNISTYEDILTGFMKNIFKDKYKNLFMDIIKVFKQNSKKTSFELLRKLDKDDLVILYNFVSKYKKILFLDKEIIEWVHEIIKEQFKNDEIIIINPTIDDLIENNIYKLLLNNKIYFVPLWIPEATYSTENKKDIIVRCIPKLPPNVVIEEQNLLVTLEIVFEKSLLDKQYYTFYLGKHEYNILLSDLVIKKEQYYTLKKNGLSSVSNSIYNISDKKDMIIKIIFI
jgi:hypothetical protein